MAEWKKVIVSGSTADLAGLTLSAAVNAGTDTDKFLVLDSSGNVDFRTGAEVLSDIGAGTGGGDITAVTAGDGLTGGATTGAATLNVGAGDGISVAADTVAVDATVLRTTGDGVVSGSAQISLGGDLSGTANSATVAKVQGVSLTSGEATQLANIGSTTISSTQWGYLGVMNQNVRTTDAVTFASVDTGQGANELYAMDQAVQSSDGVTFAGLTVNGDISARVDDTELFGFSADTGLTTIATASVSQNLTVGGDLIVNGDLTYLNTTNTAVEDQFILLGSGSTPNGADIGIIFDGAANESSNAGVAFFWDSGVSRLSYAQNVSNNATSATPGAYIPLVFDVTGASHTPDTNVGNIKIESGEAYIYV
jgi:hypothetical protein